MEIYNRNKYFKMYYMAKPIEHDDISCKAFLDFYRSVGYYEGSPHEYMERIAHQYGTTIERMKEHKECVRKLNL